MAVGTTETACRQSLFRARLGPARASTGIAGWTPNIWEDAITTQGPSRLLRALKRTRAPLTAFGMTIRFLRQMIHASSGIHRLYVKVLE